MSRTIWIATMVIGAGVLLLADPVSADSLFSRRVELSGTLVSDKYIRFQEGDVITVLVRETINASTLTRLETKKESTIEAQAGADDNATFTDPSGFNFFKPGELPNWSIEAENEHKNKGNSTRTSRLTLELSCVVTQVFENGNVFVEGEKTVTVNREDTLVALSGIVRARDVSPENTVLSNQIANVTVQLTGRGPLWNSQRRGFFTKLLDWISPF